MKFRSLLLFSTFSSAAIFFLFSALFPFLSLAATDCKDQGGHCSFVDFGGCNDGETEIRPSTAECVNTLAAQVCCKSNALCGTGANLNKGVNTAIGCLIAGDPKVFISQLLGWGVGVGGGIAFLMIVFAGFQMVTASGDPKRVQAAKELLTSAIAGLILIVLSVLLLNFIGVKILHLPGFTV